jgi:peptidoglycan/xylan/chitin deacetylase (PgdA/CDA1 family)
MSNHSPGALVISLDFELHWGMRDLFPPGSDFTDELIESRSVVAELAQLFADRQIRATWATVGMLFASSRSELEPFLPSVRPRYEDSDLDPYTEKIGVDEESDPLHLAGSLVRLIASTPGQELGSHTFSHFYCLEAGQDEQALRADLASAQAIASKSGISLTSLVLPRNQWNPRYLRAVSESGFDCYRGPQRSWAHKARTTSSTGNLARAARLADTYIGTRPPPTTAWEDVPEESGVCNVPASAFLRPYADRPRAINGLQEKRLRAGLEDAARRRRIFHLWWHPHNFARNRSENFGRLERLLDEFAVLAASEGLRSMSMQDVVYEAMGRI